LPIYLSKVGLDVEKQGIAIIPVMGKGNIAKWWRFFSAYSLPVYLVFDNDNDDDKKGNKRRDILSTLKLDTSSAEDYLVAHDWIVQERFALFGLDFEKTLRENFSSYETLEAEAKENLGDTKPIVARYVAEKLEYNTSDAGWSRINELKNMLVALVAKPSSILFESSPTMPNATDFSVAPSTLLDDEDPFAAQPPF